jgi:Na+/proline symporter
MNLPKNPRTGILFAAIGGLAYLLFSSVQSFTYVDLGMGGFISTEFDIRWLVGSIVGCFFIGILWSLLWTRISGEQDSN